MRSHHQQHPHQCTILYTYLKTGYLFTSIKNVIGVLTRCPVAYGEPAWSRHIYAFEKRKFYHFTIYNNLECFFFLRFQGESTVRVTVAGGLRRIAPIYVLFSNICRYSNTACAVPLYLFAVWWMISSDCGAPHYISGETTR